MGKDTKPEKVTAAEQADASFPYGANASSEKPIDEELTKLIRDEGLRPPAGSVDEFEEPSLIVTWNEYMAEVDEVVESLLGDALIVPGGSYTILGGPGGVGKTILWTNLIFALASGAGEFLGFRLPGRPVRVFLAEAEGSRARFRKRLKAVAEALGFPVEDLPIVFPTKDAKLWIADEDFPRMIEKSRAEFALLDPVTAFHDGEDNSNTDWRKCVRGPLGDLSKQTGTAFGLSDHYGKPSDAKTGRHKLIGASAKINDAGAALRLEIAKGGTGKRLLFFDRVRDGGLPFPEQGEEQKMHLLISVAAGTIEVDDRPDADSGPTRDARLDRIAAIVGELAGDGGEAKTAEIQKRLMGDFDVKGAQAGNLIASALDAGKIERVRKGVYRLPGGLL